jgi:ribonuclease P protein component
LNNYEAPISTVEDPPETAARVPEPELDEERAGHAGQPAPGGPETADTGLIGGAMPSGTPRRTLGRRQRLKQARDFSRTRSEGRRVKSGCLIANWRDLPEGATARVGVITTRRLGNAVARARARRLLREAYRLHQHDLGAPVDLVLVAQDAIRGKGLATVENDLLAALRRGGILKAQ